MLSMGPQLETRLDRSLALPIRTGSFGALTGRLTALRGTRFESLSCPVRHGGRLELESHRHKRPVKLCIECERRESGSAVPIDVQFSIPDDQR